MGSQTSTPGHAGLDEHMSDASCAATSPTGTAVSAPPLAQPQQSAGTRAQSLSTAHSGASPGAVAHAHTWQPASSTANPPAHD